MVKQDRAQSSEVEQGQVRFEHFQVRLSIVK